MIELWELRGDDDRRYSNFSWRTRLALRHKGLKKGVASLCIGGGEATAVAVELV